MKRKNLRKLTLCSETLLVLEDRQLAGKAGARPIPTGPYATCFPCVVQTGMDDTCYNC